MRRRSSIAVYLGVFLLLGSSFAGQSTPDSGTKFSASTELVLVPAVVTDNSGNHVPNLNKEDFVLKEDGKTRTLSVFEEVTTDKSRLERATGEKGQFSNFDPGEGRHRLTIIVLDLINTPFNDLSNARKALIDFLTRAAESGEPMCLLALDRGGVTVIHEFTSDPGILADALRRLPSNSAPLIHESIVAAAAPAGSDRTAEALRRLIRSMTQNEKQMESAERRDTVILTMDGLNQIAAALGGLPGRKSLIWASSGFSYSLSSPTKMMCEPACPVDQRASVQGLYDRLWRTMNNAQIAIYSVDLRSLTAGNFQASSGTDQFTHPYEVGDPDFDKAAEANWEVHDTATSLKLFAENTGGKAFTNTNDLSEAFRQAVEDDTHYYLLGYYVDRNQTKPGWHKLAVTSKKKGLHPRYRNGFLRADPNHEDTGPQQIRLALLSPLDFTGIPMTVTWSGRGPGKDRGQSKVQFDLVMPANFAFVDETDQNHMNVEIAVVARNGKGEVAGQVSQKVDTHLKPEAWSQIRQSGMTYRNALQLLPGDYMVRFVVRDVLSDRLGSVAVPLQLSP
ncbi:MAG TPA: VWA domain-containing protein [Terriglobales bacterium]|nr:VWA domain-containing protein [Terriglobales bacterium]